MALRPKRGPAFGVEPALGVLPLLARPRAALGHGQPALGEADMFVDLGALPLRSLQVRRQRG